MENCIRCGAEMTEEDGRYTCPECGASYRIDDEDEGDLYDGRPQVCTGCGGEWPDCAESCSRI